MCTQHMARQFHGETQVPTLPSSKKGKVCNSRSSGVGGRIKQDDKCSSVVVLFFWTPELQHDEGLLNTFTPLSPFLDEKSFVRLL